MNIPIFLSSDNNYAPFVATTIASICDNTKSFCEFYVLDGKITEEKKEKIGKLKEQFDNFSLEYIEVKENELLSDFEYKNKSTHVSISTYYRFFITKLKPTIKRAIYLDIDIIAIGDIENLWKQDLNGNTLGIIKDEGENDLIIKFKEKYSLANYYNAGVLLIDLRKWEEKQYSKLTFEFELQNRNNLNFADQDIINVLFKDDCIQLEQKFNEQLYFNKNTVIRHFANIYKPWKYNYFKVGNGITPLANFDDFWKYAKYTEFYENLMKEYKSSINSNMLTKRFSSIAEKLKKEC